MRRRLLLIALTAALLAPACSRPPPPSAASQPASGPTGDPRAALAELARLRAARQYRALSDLVVPPHGEPVVRFLLAVDEFLTANDRLCAWLRDRAAVGLSQIVDQAYVADDLAEFAGDSLGVFSREIELLDARVEGDRAFVSYTVPQRLTPRQARLRLDRSTWRLDPGGALSDSLPTAFQEFARGLEQVVKELELGYIPSADLTANPELLTEKVKARLRRGVALLSRARTERGE